MKNQSQFISVALILLVFSGLSSCKKENPIRPGLKLDFEISHVFDSLQLVWDQQGYLNAAGNDLSFSRVEYIVSGIKLKQISGGGFSAPSAYFVSPGADGKDRFTLNEVPEGTYSGIEFVFGLKPEKNISKSLSSDQDFLRFEWPEPMGGGYHFMKLEGHFLSVDTLYGYGIHIGSNGFYLEYDFPSDFEVVEGANGVAGVEVFLQMDLSQWFKTPYTYNFSSDPNYTMGDSTSMMHIVSNGSDAFTLIGVN